MPWLWPTLYIRGRRPKLRRVAFACVRASAGVKNVEPPPSPGVPDRSSYKTQHFFRLHARQMCGMWDGAVPTTYAVQYQGKLLVTLIAHHVCVESIKPVVASQVPRFGINNKENRETYEYFYINNTGPTTTTALFFFFFFGHPFSPFFSSLLFVFSPSPSPGSSDPVSLKAGHHLLFSRNERYLPLLSFYRALGFIQPLPSLQLVDY